SAMCSLGNNAGAAKFGNFRNYYQFNKPEARLERLPDDLSSFCMLNEQRQIVALDIGCNSGALTTQLYRMLTASGSGYVKVLAIDIDESLIQCAEKSNPFPDSIEYMCLDIMADTSGQAIADYLARYSHKTFDITFCFSVTMWIHLNHGDEGLKSFLVSVCANTRYLLLEAQLWKCYRSASRRMRRASCDEFQHLDTLRMNINVEENIHSFLLGRCCMELVQCFGQTQWDRKVTLYRKL
ncbi:conserved hypothetical protein, partial [Ixodes scapularis]